MTPEEIRAQSYTPPEPIGLREEETIVYRAEWQDEQEFKIRREIAAQLAELVAELKKQNSRSIFEQTFGR